jgi:hypothetical protein
MAPQTTLIALAAVAGHGFTVQQGRREGPADLAQPREARQADQLAAGAAEGVDGAMVAHVDLGALAVELGLRAVARVREPARVFQAVGSIGGMKGKATLLSQQWRQAGWYLRLPHPHGVADEWPPIARSTKATRSSALTAAMIRAP